MHSIPGTLPVPCVNHTQAPRPPGPTGAQHWMPIAPFPMGWLWQGVLQALSPRCCPGAGALTLLGAAAVAAAPTDSERPGITQSQGPAAATGLASSGAPEHCGQLLWSHVRSPGPGVTFSDLEKPLEKHKPRKLQRTSKS